jgi:hypothetical protein
VDAPKHKPKDLRVLLMDDVSVMDASRRFKGANTHRDWLENLNHFLGMNPPLQSSGCSPIRSSGRSIPAL